MELIGRNHFQYSRLVEDHSHDNTKCLLRSCASRLPRQPQEGTLLLLVAAQRPVPSGQAGLEVTFSLFPFSSHFKDRIFCDCTYRPDEIIGSKILNESLYLCSLAHSVGVSLFPYCAIGAFCVGCI